ncbi:CRISPR-associated endoribonuclease Cas6 [Mangrovibacterium marinum]|uniref:CRISPR-associated endoribonuclease Cas6 n=1 Tax=Mangrovibacterium marinum TaxID=1639118 RepID=A0A2T5C474_9BACT|nr:CRISPR-associated endoribonuclease Cas6 [Mangrovibacterium marinum]PTN09607.1 CRISPR-associated endoribonuclease Cas6 [Mangrovibacterium marinum]
MRFKITFNRTTRQRMLPMDYQYYISAWIYKVLKQADSDFAQFLHERGYGQSDSKLYKLFCFSRLNFGRPKLWKEKKLFEISAPQIELQISFDVDQAATNFIKGLFMSQEFYLGDRFNGIDFKVTGVEALPEPEFRETMRYRLQTPWVVSFQPEAACNPQYLSPGDEAFDALATKHLIEKYNNTRQPLSIGTEQVGMRRLTDFKRAGFVVKPGTAQQTRIVGNLFDFELTAPVELHRLIWNAGASEKSSSGFGWVEIVPANFLSGSNRNGCDGHRNKAGLNRNIVGSVRNVSG